MPATEITLEIPDGPPPKGRVWIKTPYKTERLCKAPPSELTPSAGETPQGPPQSKRSQKNRGQNKRKARQFHYENNPVDLCAHVAVGRPCADGPGGTPCHRSEDVAAYLSHKSRELDADCVFAVTRGECPFGYRCQFLKAHSTPGDDALPQLQVFDVRRQAYDAEIAKFRAPPQTAYHAHWRNLFTQWLDAEETRALVAEHQAALEQLQSLVAARAASEAWRSLGVAADHDAAVWELETRLAALRLAISHPEPSFTFNRFPKDLQMRVRCGKYAYKRVPQYLAVMERISALRDARHAQFRAAGVSGSEQVLCEACDSVILPAEIQGASACLCDDIDRFLRNPELLDDSRDASEVSIDTTPGDSAASGQPTTDALENDTERLAAKPHGESIAYIPWMPTTQRAPSAGEATRLTDAQFPSDPDWAAQDPAVTHERYLAQSKLDLLRVETNKDRASAAQPTRLPRREKPRLDLRDRLYLAPLTTVGNLPFRRLCTQMGAEVTCSEMVMAECLLRGQASEWARLQRHSSEPLFGAQICGGNVDTVARACEVIERELDVDFVDLNMGCPLDDVCRKGGGSGLMGRPKRMGDILRGMDHAMETTPVTAKLRIGLRGGQPLVHKIVPRLRHLGVQAVTLHGRTKEQRYSKYADWRWVDFVARVAQRDGGGDSAAAPLQVLGNGDVLSWQEYELKRAQCPNVAGVMIGRGALIKPWLFTEVAERRDWDISAGERFELLRAFARFGLEHWGSDAVGVSTTRRYLLEHISFTHRYVPLGLLERLPMLMNERPYPFSGRSELETLMGSTQASDWVALTERIPELGPVPCDFVFTPKHKANAYDAPRPETK